MKAHEVVHQAERLAGEIAVGIYEDFWAKTTYRYSDTTWELLGSDDAEEFGLPMDDPYITVLRRESDGQAFEIEIEVTARALEPLPPRRAEIPGQQSLPEVAL